MAKQYSRIRADMAKLLKNEGLDALGHRVEIITTRLSMVSISLRDPTVAPKIFERLNYGAEPVTVADLVRNEVFARSGDDPQNALHLFSSRWEPFVGKFQDKNADLDRFLFPYGLMHNPNVKKADLFSALRKKWENLAGPKDIIDDLEQYQPAYLGLTSGASYCVDKPKLSLRVQRIYRAGRPSSIYPFVLNLLRNFELDLISETTAANALDLIESFLFRRALSGIEPTGLHAVFKGLWQELVLDKQTKPLDDAVSVERIRAAIEAKATIAWPKDDEFASAIRSGDLYRRKIVGYALREYEIALKGETPQDAHQAEHIAPQTPTDSWKSNIPDEYEKVVHTWGNLLPLTSTMNPSTGQSDFSQKREAYANSIFASAREVAELAVWNVDAIRKRSDTIANWAIKRWPY